MTKPSDDELIDAQHACAWKVLGAHTGRLGPDAVLCALSALDGSADEKLRRFAVWIEANVLPDWPVVRDLYAEAARRNPTNTRVQHAFAVAAVNYADMAPETERQSLLAQAIRAAKEGIRLDPSDPDLHHVLGLALYAAEPSRVAEAERAFRAAVALRPNFATARLYLAHCLEDMARWNEALQEFRRVDESRLLAELGSAQAWRVARMREHIAVCLLRLGRQQEAEKAILRFLDMAEAAASGDLEPPEQLVALVGLLPNALAARIRAVARGKPLFPAEPDRS